MNLFNRKSHRDELLNHWIAFAESFSFAPQEFYQLIEAKIMERKLPGLTVSRIEYGEGGLLSESRVYLRMIRERLAFDMCAAPFGTGYLFSCRSVYSPVLLRWWHLLAVLLFSYVSFGSLWLLLDFQFAVIAEVTLLLAIFKVFRNVGRARQFDLDETLLKIPVAAAIYERWFRADTYYRTDTRLAFLEIISGIVKEAADEVTAAKGVKLHRQYQCAPVLGALYQPLLPTLGEEIARGIKPSAA